MTTKKSVLYIINFYGTPPLNYFEKYLTRQTNTRLTILKLPAVRSNKYRLLIDAFIKDEEGITHPIKFNLFFPLPYFFVFFFQYICNFFLAFILLRKINRKKFDIIMGETNFGSALAYLLKVLKRGTFSVYFNGDILPIPSLSAACFFLPNTTTPLQPLFKFIDTLIVHLQYFLRTIGYRNDLIWYGNTKIKAWDTQQHLRSSQFIIHDAIKIDLDMFYRWSTSKKNPYDLCYIGRIDDYVGLDIIIPALALLKRDFPLIKLHIIGGSSTTAQKYKQLARAQGVDTYVVFHGHVPHMQDAQAIMSTCVLGMALYKPVPDNVSMFAQPAKPKDYIQVGVPVLVTRGGPAIGDDIVQHTAGVFADFTVQSVYATIATVLRDTKKRTALIRGVRRYARKHDYQKSFAQVWSDIISRAPVE